MRFRYIFLSIILIAIVHFSAKAQQAPVDLYGSSGYGLMGDIIKIDIQVNEFTDIIAFQASLNWDPGLLRFISVSDFGIKDFGENSFGLTNADKGHVRFLWEPADAIAITESDSTRLFSASFEILSDQAQSVTIGYVDVISNPAFPLEFANDNFEILTVNTYDGKITIFSDATDLVNIESTPNTSCDEKADNGSLKADIYGDSINYTFQWFIGDKVGATPDYIGYRYDKIQGGAYTLQVLDKDEQVFVESMAAIVLDQPAGTPDIITEISNLPQTSCSTDPNKLTGSIEIAANDSQPENTFNISWWKDDYDNGQEIVDFQNLYVASKLDAGNYEIAIENQHTGCKSYHKSSISEDLIQFEIVLSSTKNNFCSDGANGSVTAELITQGMFNLQYYWFLENDASDSTQALYKGLVYENVPAANYKSWVIDLNSDCIASGAIIVEDSLIETKAQILQRNDTLFANDARANWYRNDINLNITSEYIVPTKSGTYFFTITNEFNCISESGSIYYGITGFEEMTSDISIYPNPFNEFIRISNPDSDIDFIQIYSTKGALIQEFYTIKDKFIDIYLTGSSDGIYLVRIGKNGIVHSRKVVKNLSK